MPALQSGAIAPEITLPTLDGKSFSLQEARKRGPVLLVFFKVSCPVCQFSMPYLDRLFRAAGANGPAVIGISQDKKQETESFCREYGATFPIALDDTTKYPASNAYGLTNVPSFFLVSPDGEIEISSVGWSRADLERIAQAMGRTAHK